MFCDLSCFVCHVSAVQYVNVVVQLAGALPLSTSRAQFDLWVSDPNRTLEVGALALWSVADADKSGDLSASEIASFSQIADRHRPAPSFHKVSCSVQCLIPCVGST